MLREHRLFIGEYHRNVVVSLLLHRRIQTDILGDAWNCINSQKLQYKTWWRWSTPPTTTTTTTTTKTPLSSSLHKIVFVFCF